MYVENFGSYTTASSSEFNGIPRPSSKYIFRD